MFPEMKQINLYDFGLMLRSKRLRSVMTRKNLSEKLKFGSERTIQKIESNEGFCSAERLLPVLNFMGCGLFVDEGEIYHVPKEFSLAEVISKGNNGNEVFANAKEEILKRSPHSNMEDATGIKPYQKSNLTTIKRYLRISIDTGLSFLFTRGKIFCGNE